MITTPNFSLPLDVVRPDNLHNMKRIAICWAELILAGNPTSLHLNGRTDCDWKRWAEFVAEREEVRSVCFEFATGPKRPEWGKWYVQKLVELASIVGRELDLIVRGGYPYLNTLKRSYRHVSYIDTSSFMKTINRQRFIRTPDARPDWLPGKTDTGENLDSLFAHNVELYGQLVAEQ